MKQLCASARTQSGSNSHLIPPCSLDARISIIHDGGRSRLKGNLHNKTNSGQVKITTSQIKAADMLFGSSKGVFS